MYFAGGFTNLVQEYPRIDLSNPQPNPKLYERASKAAWMTNAYTMLYYNITTMTNETTGKKAYEYINSEVGARFWLSNQGTSGDYDTLSLSDRWYNHLGLTTKPNKARGDVDLPVATNPFGITTSNFSDISTLHWMTAIEA